MKVTIDISSEEAENILFALTLRSKQSKLSSVRQDETVELGKSLDGTFAQAFGWDKSIDRMNLMRRPIKNVSIKCYDLSPHEG